jgi:hypothetical protein
MEKMGKMGKKAAEQRVAPGGFSEIRVNARKLLFG